MNDERRQKIAKIMGGLEWTGEDLRHHKADYLSLGRMFAPLAEHLEAVRDEELESLQSVPMGLRSGHRGEVAQERLEFLNEALEIAEALEAQAADEDSIPYYLDYIVRVLEYAVS